MFSINLYFIIFYLFIILIAGIALLMFMSNGILLHPLKATYCDKVHSFVNPLEQDTSISLITFGRVTKLLRFNHFIYIYAYY